MATFYRIYEKLLEFITILLMLSLASIVVIAVIFRWSGNSLEWYDEIAAILLAWLTYYAAALGALKRSHIGIPALVVAMSPKFRAPVVLLAEAITIGFFVLLAWVGYEVLLILKYDTLVTIEIPLQYTQSVIPIGAVLYIVGELLNFPQIWREATGRAEMKVKH